MATERLWSRAACLPLLPIDGHQPGGADVTLTNRKKPHLRRCGLVLIVVTVLVAGAALPADAKPPDPASNSTDLLARAQPDECFTTVGGPKPAMKPNGKCPAGSVPRVNQHYVWSLFTNDQEPYVWWGTGSNVICYGYNFFKLFYDLEPALEVPESVCEGDATTYENPFLNPLIFGDTRPPQVFRMNKATGDITEMTPTDDPNINGIIGLRSVGVNDGVIIFGGPSATAESSGFEDDVTMLAYNLATGEYLGSHVFPEIQNVRKWTVIDGVLYAAVKNEVGGGFVWRWNGSLADPFNFETVGGCDFCEPAEITSFENRFVVSTWNGPDSQDPTVPFPDPELLGIPKLLISQPVPAGGFTAANPANLVRAWGPDDSDPSALSAHSLSMGPATEFNGDLYWGQVTIPINQQTAHFQTYGIPDTSLEKVLVLVNAGRSCSYYRGRNLGTPQQEVELLYGASELNRFDEATGTWVAEPVKDGPPLFGGQGFGNLYNVYCWSQTVFQNELYIGTNDSSFYSSMLEPMAPVVGLEGVLLTLAQNLADELKVTRGGFDVFKFTSPDQPAVPVTTNGFCNPAANGLRNMQATSDFLYLGTTSFSNLLTDKKAPYGGWELRQLPAAKNAKPKCEPVGEVPNDQESINKLLYAIAGLNIHG
jgi:hypothetical protein